MSAIELLMTRTSQVQEMSLRRALGRFRLYAFCGHRRLDVRLSQEIIRSML